MSSPRQARRGTPAADDRGFSLVEVMLALVLLSLIMASMGGLFIKGIRHSGDLQRRQAAVTLAQQALEAARAVSATPDASGCVKLLQGRSAAAVAVQWAEAPTAVTSVTDQASAPGTCSLSAVVPLQGLPGAAGSATDPVLLQNLPYTVQTYIGTCVLTSSRASCLRATDVPGGSPTLYRVVARVTWSGAGCNGSTCEYSASTLLDPSSDPVFNVRGAAAPMSVADDVCLPSGGAGTINIISNDTGALGSTPVTIVTPPSKGTLSANIRSGVGAYTPSGGHRKDSFSYYLTDVNGVLSGTVTVTVTLGGCP